MPEGPQTAQVIDSLVRDGNKMIFATSFGYQDAMAAAAKKYPDVKFEQATGYKLAKNLAEYYGAGEDAIYLSGMAAGAATKKGVVGYVVPFAIPEVIRHTNAFALGVQATHPGATVKIVWTKSWLAPDKEKKAAESLHTSGGADVMGQNVDSPAAGQYSETAGIPWVGYDSDAQVVRTQVVAHRRGLQLGPVLPQGGQGGYRRHVEERLLLGRLERRLHEPRPVRRRRLGQDEGAIAAKMAAIKKGSFYEFQGPLYDQAGKLRVPKGKKLSLGDILAMNWLVKGVVGSPEGLIDLP